MRARHRVGLSAQQHQVCEEILASPEARTLAKRRARVLLNADVHGSEQERSDQEIADLAGVESRTVRRVRTSFVRDGFAATLHGTPRGPKTSTKLTPAQEGRLLALMDTAPPLGYPRWTIRTLAERLQSLDGMPPVSRELVRRTLNRHQKRTTCVSCVLLGLGSLVIPGQLPM